MKQVEADVVVIASGPGGLAAAITAAQGGASVILFEKKAITGGNSNAEVSAAMNFLAIESRLQRQNSITLTREEALKIHMDYTHWRVDARLVKVYYDKSASTIDWIEKLGVEFTEPTGHGLRQNPTTHQIKGPAWDGDTMKRWSPQGGVIGEVLTARAKEMGVKFFLETPAKKLIKENGKITGVIAEDKSGEEIRAKAKAVVIATGGCSDNPEMMKKYTGYEWGKDMFHLKIPGLAGDGIKMAWEAGAGSTDIMVTLNCTLPVGWHPLRHTPAVTAFLPSSNIFVNLLGERYMNEEIIQENMAFAGNATFRQKNACGFSIFDSDTKKYYEENGSYWRPMPIAAGYDASLEKLRAAWPDCDKHIFIADSLEELASKTEINLEGLRQTIAEYNGYCETGRDKLFDKNYRFLRPVKQPPFYAGRLAASGYGTFGGIKINYKAEVITKDFDVIPGLYAAGSDANSIFGDTYVFLLPGNMVGFALNSGRIAGESVLEYIKSV